MTTLSHARPYGRFISKQSKLRRKKLYRTNKASNFLGGSFSNRDNVRASTQLRRERQPQYLTRWILLRNGTIHLHINSTTVIRPVTSNKLTFSSTEVNKLPSAPVHRVSKIFKFGFTPYKAEQPLRGMGFGEKEV